MSILDHRSIFTTMLQNGPFSIDDQVLFPRTFSKETKIWIKSAINGNPVLKTKYRAVRNQILELLGIESFQQIPDLLDDGEQRKTVAVRAQQLLGNMFGIDERSNNIDRYLRGYAETADDVINSLRAKVLAPYSVHIEMNNEISATSNPVELLLITFDNRFHRKARFEAKRKLMLMNLAGSIDQRERETDIEGKFSNFIDFLNEFVWSPRQKIGDLEVSYLHSQHHTDDFRCTDVRVLSEAQAVAITPGPGEKLTLVKRRNFLDQDREIPIYVTIRKKPAAAKVLKLLRKNQKNPAVAVDDELGLMAVLNSTADVKRFLKHLTRSAINKKSLMTLEDISDTLTGGKYTSSAAGSCAKTPMLKFFARIEGMRVEFIVHTNRSYLNYMFQRQVSHDEYEVKRIFDSGVAEFLFPTEIYHINLQEIRDRRIAWFRKRNEEGTD